MLFSPFTLRGVTVLNRIVVSPMSQYAAHDGLAHDWRLAHLPRFVLGGAGLVFTEATAVTADGRRTPGDLGLWRDDQIAPLVPMAAFAREHGVVSGIQLGHAGRKASERRPWHNGGPLNDEDVALRGGGALTDAGPVGPGLGEGRHVPAEMSRDQIDHVVTAFAAAARRADEAGFDVVEVYAGHGFPVHQFCSPLSNLRDDDYGGALNGRMRFALEVAESIRSCWRAHCANAAST